MALAAHRSAFGVTEEMLSSPPPGAQEMLDAFRPVFEREVFVLGGHDSGHAVAVAGFLRWRSVRDPGHVNSLILSAWSSPSLTRRRHALVVYQEERTLGDDEDPRSPRRRIWLRRSLCSDGVRSRRPVHDCVRDVRPAQHGHLHRGWRRPHERMLVPDAMFDSNPSFSTDGRWVLFSSRRRGSVDIYRVQVDGTHLERLTDDVAFDDQPVMSPDGQHVAFVSSRTGQADIWLLDLQTAWRSQPDQPSRRRLPARVLA